MRTTAMRLSALVLGLLAVPGRVRLYNGSGKPLHLVADVEGYFTTAMAKDFVPAQQPKAPSSPPQPVAPFRVVDTRTGLSPQGSVPKGRIGVHRGVMMYLPGLVGEGEQPLAALVLNLTPVNPDASGWLWADYISPSAAAPTSAANYVARQSVSNSFVAPAESGGLDVSFANMSTGSTDLVVDVSGWFA